MTFKSSWWKLLGMLLVMGSIFVGLSTKTGPGVASVTPTQIVPSTDFTLEIVGYNTDFQSSEIPSVWLKHNNNLICAKNVQVLDPNHLSATFSAIPVRLDVVQRIAPHILIEDKTNGLFLGLGMIQLKFESDSVGKTETCANVPQKLSSSNYSFPFRTTLYESIRNLNFHVPMWFTMIILLLVSFITAIMYLNKGNVLYDQMSKAFAGVGLLFGIIGIATGAVWARFTWGTFWTADPKLNGAAVAVLMYIAYQILRSSIEDEDKVARISAVYNILAYPIFVVLIIVLPKLAAFSLHPGSGDSVGFDQYDLDSNLRMIFYPAVLGWILTGTWIAQVVYRYSILKSKQESQDE